MDDGSMREISGKLRVLSQKVLDGVPYLFNNFTFVKHSEENRHERTKQSSAKSCGTLGPIAHVPGEVFRLCFSQGSQVEILSSECDPRATLGEIFDLPFLGSAAVGASPLEYGLPILPTRRKPFGVGGFNRAAPPCADPGRGAYMVNVFIFYETSAASFALRLHCFPARPVAPFTLRVRNSRSAGAS